MPRLLVLDNYDSFTYNLVHLVKQLGYWDLEVVRNDKIDLARVDEFEKILLSPGPGIPSEAGAMPELVRRYAPHKSILGICLGHQCIGEAFGAQLINLKDVVHGKGMVTRVVDGEETLFHGLPECFVTGRYHSWAVSQDSFPASLAITAVDEEGCIMGLRHRDYDVKGLQFHPESVLTENGETIIKNWLSG
jgi:anthranilate synthase component II